jgi:hypothetical protein
MTCVWANVDYLDYTAREAIYGGNCLSAHADPYVIYAPTAGAQDNFECRRGDKCQELGSEDWIHDGKECPR